MLLIIDNYDSFTWNLVHLVGELGVAAEVMRNDALDVAGALARAPQAILLSPGPGAPETAGICVELAMNAAAQRIPVLGVCLGHQAIGQAFGGRIIRHNEIVHGKLASIDHDGSGVFAGVPSPMRATRYHSLVIDRAALPPALRITATTEDGAIMGVAHRSLPVHGLQFHPESIASEHGAALMRNFLSLSGPAQRGAA
ncbi:MAG: aminodeoxychorismate/anthranilate synthase component II [Pseudomonadota bacterium]